MRYVLSPSPFANKCVCIYVLIPSYTCYVFTSKGVLVVILPNVPLEM